MTRPDDPVDRRRALAARATTLEPSVAWLIKGCRDLGVPLPPVPREVDKLPAMFRRLADTIQRVQP